MYLKHLSLTNFRNFARLDIDVPQRVVLLVGANAQGKTSVLEAVKKPVSEVIGHFNAVIFVPQMSQIIEGAPEDRRRYLNLALAQSTPAYARILSEYSQALTQRNALLKLLGERGGSGDKRSSPADQLEVWDEPLARLG